MTDLSTRSIALLRSIHEAGDEKAIGKLLEDVPGDDERIHWLIEYEYVVPQHDIVVVTSGGRRQLELQVA